MKIGLKESIALIFIAFVLAMLLLISNSKSQNIKTIEKASEAQIVSNSTDFYDVNGIIDQYIEAIKHRATDDLVSMLNNDYVLKNHITTANVLEFLPDLSDNNYSFSAVKMYYIKITDDITEFYVYGQLTVETLDGGSDQKDFYVNVLVDQENKIYSIIPDDGRLYKEASNEN